MSRTRVWRWTLACVLAGAGCPACLAACSLSTTGLAFGPYDVFSPLNHDITGTITVSCDPGAPYSLSLSSGSGTYASRVMTDGIYTLGYNLFLDPTRLSIWGDGTAGTGVVSGNAFDAIHTVYGRIPARQNAHVGTYTDTIIVTVTF